MQIEKNSQIAVMQDLHPLWILFKKAQVEESKQDT